MNGQPLHVSALGIPPSLSIPPIFHASYDSKISNKIYRLKDIIIKNERYIPRIERDIIENEKIYSLMEKNILGIKIYILQNEKIYFMK